MLGLLGMLGGVFSNFSFWQELAGSREGQALTLPLTFPLLAVILAVVAGWLP